MLSVAEAQDHVLGLCAILPSETIPIAKAIDRVLSQAVYAQRHHPPFAASAFDGYALRRADLKNCPAQLHIVGESHAGAGFIGEILPGAAVRILTGAPVPEPCDCVVPQEQTRREGALLTVLAPPQGDHIRPIGLDVQQSALVANAHERLTPARLGLLAAAGITDVSVTCVPRVEMIICGDELKHPGETLGPAEITSTNGLVLGTLLHRAGAHVVGADRIVPDSMPILSAHIEASKADILLTVGGASVGDRDFVQEALRACGADIHFWKVALKPGKPLMLGKRGDQIILGLPGNPVSAYVCAVLFVLPALHRLLGLKAALPTPHTGRVRCDLPAVGSRAEYLRAQSWIEEGEEWIEPFAVQDSAMLSVLAAANALLIRPAGAAEVAAGGSVGFLRLDA